MDIIKAAKDTLKIELEGILALEKSFDAEFGKEFEKSVNKILSISGRVILCGMGKSGHIAKKIAATLASTGTPSFFLHPAEASHGDLGMITEKDCVIALSKSGKTAELEATLQFTKRYAIPLIAITENPDSLLAKSADYKLILPKAPEACPHGAAPTTSTTLMLILGDAIALSLLKARGFTAEDFNTYHPGGSLGKKLQLVRDIMHIGDSIPLASDTMTMAEALILMTKYSFGSLAIHKDNTLLGLITDGDLRRSMNANLLNQQTKDIMNTSPITIQSDSLVASALQIMNSKKITSLLVVDNNKIVGIVHIHDCLRNS